MFEIVLEGLVCPVSGVWSWKDLIPMGILLCLVEGIFLRVRGKLETWNLVLWTACAVGVSMPSLLSVILSVGVMNLPRLLPQGSHLIHCSHLLMSCH